MLITVPLIIFCFTIICVLQLRNNQYISNLQQVRTLQYQNFDIASELYVYVNEKTDYKFSNYSVIDVINILNKEDIEIEDSYTQYRLIQYNENMKTINLKDKLENCIDTINSILWFNKDN